jgi:hypothetical protein
MMPPPVLGKEEERVPRKTETFHANLFLHNDETQIRVGEIIKRN